VYGIAKNVAIVCWFALISELEAVDHTKRFMKCPSIAVIGGIKVSTKFKVIESLCKRFDHVLIGGANGKYFYGALGYKMGKSFVEKSFTNNHHNSLRNILHASFYQLIWWGWEKESVVRL
jgi:phosphoglycerate kinase